MDKTVLIVEDDRLLAMLLASNLDAMGYSVVGNVSSPSLGAGLARELRPGAVLMAVSMDDGDGALEAARYIRGRHGIPVVFLSGLLDSEIKKQAAGIARDMILEKPFDDYELQSVLEGIFREKPSRFSIDGVIEE